MELRAIVQELTRERGSLTGKRADECARLNMRGLVILISGVLFCCSFVTVGAPLAGIGVLLIHMANKQPYPSLAAKGSDPVVAGEFYWVQFGEDILRVRVTAIPVFANGLYRCRDTHGRRVGCALADFIGPAVPVLRSELAEFE